MGQIGTFPPVFGRSVDAVENSPADTFGKRYGEVPYSVNTVSRRTVFVFGAGRPVFELLDPQGQRWVMQSWSQTVDPTLSLADLPALGARLQLPDGWSYRTSTLTSPLRIDTTTEAAHVTQDDLGNTYSLAVA